MNELLALYERNRRSAEYFTSGGLGIKPKLNTIILTCLDSRVDPAHFFGLQPGEALVMRNGGGRVTDAVERDLAYVWTLIAIAASVDLPPLSLAVIHHVDCGLERIANLQARKAVSVRSGLKMPFLEKIAISNHEEAIRYDLEKLKRSDVVPKHLTVSGHMYDPKNGTLREVVGPTLLSSFENQAAHSHPAEQRDATNVLV